MSDEPTPDDTKQEDVPQEPVQEQTADETPKKDIASKVITRKRRYFFPEHGISIKASSLAMAVSIVKRKQVKRKDGDG